MDRIYHGCVYANADGTRKIIANGENYLVRTNKCFWKDLVDVLTQIKTQLHDQEGKVCFDACLS